MRKHWVFCLWWGMLPIRPAFDALHQNLVRKSDERCLCARTQAPRRDSLLFAKPPASQTKTMVYIAEGAYHQPLWGCISSRASVHLPAA